MKPTISLNSIKLLLKEGGPGKYTPESIAKAREIIEDLTKQIGTTARELANNAGKKRVTEEEIKLATKFYIK